MCDGPPTVFEKLRNAQEGGNSAYLTTQDVTDLRVSLGDSFNDIEKLRDACKILAHLTENPTTLDHDSCRT